MKSLEQRIADREQLIAGLKLYLVTACLWTSKGCANVFQYLTTIFTKAVCFLLTKQVQLKDQS